MGRVGGGTSAGDSDGARGGGDSADLEPPCPTTEPVDGNGPIVPQMLAQEAMLRYPATVAVFQRHGLPCPGCLASGYESITQISVMLGVPLATLLAALNQAAAPPSRTP